MSFLLVWFGLVWFVMPWFPAKTRAQQTTHHLLTTEILSFTKLSGQKVTELHGPALVLSRLAVIYTDLRNDCAAGSP